MVPFTTSNGTNTIMGFSTSTKLTSLLQFPETDIRWASACKSVVAEELQEVVIPDPNARDTLSLSVEVRSVHVSGKTKLSEESRCPLRELTSEETATWPPSFVAVRVCVPRDPTTDTTRLAETSTALSALRESASRNTLTTVGLPLTSLTLLFQSCTP